MASMGGGYLDPAPLIRTVKHGGYINRLLQNICAAEGLSKLGVKAELQNRIVERIQLHANNNDAIRFDRLRRFIESPHDIPAQPQAWMGGGPANFQIGNPPPPVSRPANDYGRGSNMAGGVSSWRGNGQPRGIEFKESPYFKIEQQLGEPALCDVMTQHRHTAKTSIRVADYPILSRVLKEPSLRILVFCAAEGNGRQDISFPHQSEIKVNGAGIQANLRGLKNKPGSTRPVDITEKLRLNIAAYVNNVELVYALTNKKYYMVIYVAKAISVAELVKQIENGRRITEKSVLDEMANKARDADIVVGASVLSLKCPLSTLRIDLPCRSITCRHNQCFDTTSYLQLQEQGPTWLCPICNNPAPFSTLAVDEYLRNILKSTHGEIDQVTVQPDGIWQVHVKPEPARPSRMANGAESDSDDDLVEITKTGDFVSMGAPKPGPAAIPPNSAARSFSREQSSSSGVARTGSTANGKRPAAVIDLTSSGDEDEEPLSRAPKRQQTVNGYNSLPPPVFRPVQPYNGYPPYPPNRNN